MNTDDKYRNLVMSVEKLMADLGVQGKVDASGVFQAPNQSLGYERDLARYVKMGKDFEVILKEIHSNELLMGQWKKLTMSLRLTGQ